MIPTSAVIPDEAFADIWSAGANLGAFAGWAVLAVVTGFGFVILRAILESDRQARRARPASVIARPRVDDTRGRPAA